MCRSRPENLESESDKCTDCIGDGDSDDTDVLNADWLML